MQFREEAFNSINFRDVISRANKNEMVLQLLNCKQVLSNLLTSYHFAERGSVREIDIVAESIVINAAGEVEFNIIYKTQHRYACDGITHEYDKAMKICLQINDAEQKLIFIGEHWPERDGEEF